MNKEYFENLLTTLEHLPPGKSSSKTHLKMTLYTNYKNGSIRILNI